MKYFRSKNRCYIIIGIFIIVSFQFMWILLFGMYQPGPNYVKHYLPSKNNITCETFEKILNEQNKAINVFHTWKTKHLMYHHKKMIYSNKNINFILFNDTETDLFMKNCIQSDNNILYKNISKVYFMINNEYGASKADVFRYVILHKYGGMYLDYDSFCKTKQFNAFIDVYLLNKYHGYFSVAPHSIWFPKYGHKNEIIQWCLLFNKNDIILENTLIHIINKFSGIKDIDTFNRKAVQNPFEIVLTHTGPHIFTESIWFSLLHNISKDSIIMENNDYNNGCKFKAINKYKWKSEHKKNGITRYTDQKKKYITKLFDE